MKARAAAAAILDERARRGRVVPLASEIFPIERLAAQQRDASAGAQAGERFARHGVVLLEGVCDTKDFVPIRRTLLGAQHEEQRCHVPGTALVQIAQHRLRLVEAPFVQQ